MLYVAIAEGLKIEKMVMDYLKDVLMPIYEDIVKQNHYLKFNTNTVERHIVAFLIKRNDIKWFENYYVNNNTINYHINNDSISLNYILKGDDVIKKEAIDDIEWRIKKLNYQIYFYSDYSNSSIRKEIIGIIKNGINQLEKIKKTIEDSIEEKE